MPSLGRILGGVLGSGVGLLGGVLSVLSLLLFYVFVHVSLLSLSLSLASGSLSRLSFFVTPFSSGGPEAPPSWVLVAPSPVPLGLGPGCHRYPSGPPIPPSEA